MHTWFVLDNPVTLAIDLVVSGQYMGRRRNTTRPFAVAAAAASSSHISAQQQLPSLSALAVSMNTGYCLCLYLFTGLKHSSFYIICLSFFPA